MAFILQATAHVASEAITCTGPLIHWSDSEISGDRMNTRLAARKIVRAVFVCLGMVILLRGNGAARNHREAARSRNQYRSAGPRGAECDRDRDQRLEPGQARTCDDRRGRRLQIPLSAPGTYRLKFTRRRIQDLREFVRDGDRY